MNQNNSRHPEDITHHMLRAAAVFFVVTFASLTFWILRDQKAGISLPATEPMSQKALPPNASP